MKAKPASERPTAARLNDTAQLLGRAIDGFLEEWILPAEEGGEGRAPDHRVRDLLNAAYIAEDDLQGAAKHFEEKEVSDEG
jgi:hypothetical protein